MASGGVGVIDPYAQPDCATVRRRAFERRWSMIFGAIIGAAAMIAFLTGHEHIGMRLSVFVTLAGGALGIIAARMIVAREQNVMVERIRAEWYGRRGKNV